MDDCYRLKNYVNTCKLPVYYSLIHSHLSYYIITWEVHQVVI